MRAAEVAARMGMALRSYQHFEGGHEKNPSLERILAFADATDTDPLAILAALQVGDPALAHACADSKLLYVLQIALEDFHARAPEAMAGVEPRLVHMVFTRLFRELAAPAAHRDRFLHLWLASPEPPRRE
jgi:hypothetical protein